LVNHLLKRAWGLRELRFVQLALVLILVMMLMPMLSQNMLIKAVSSIFLLNALLVAISTHASRRIRVTLWALWVVSAIGGVIEELPVSSGVALAAKLIAMASFLVLIVMCTSRVLRVALLSEHVTIDSIFASIVAYQLIGLLFAGFYTLLLILDPTSLHGVMNSPPVHAGLVQFDMIYFSFVTMATLGYGDIVPVTSLARGIAVTEALVGQFYVAMVVALLIGAYVSQRLEERARRRQG